MYYINNNFFKKMKATITKQKQRVIKTNQHKDKTMQII